MISKQKIDSFFKLSKIILEVNMPNRTAKVYTVKSGDTLSKISQNYGTSCSGFS
ncbi:LysM peptidoglycan-binding domain-containing protein [Rickettsia endosymbiont of Ixodes pacificus]|uniref:LysM peptidoglycan-binding domain-containing protein n=1 Tax=Rickettsia endosymbiont of Ixodes pacificus TaxID=1133329 RepID=UPI0012E05A6D|nr:LysM domain-containing protein [Rickettsia endosymbiont of Ixodes pacificus]